MATPIFTNFARTTLASGILNTDASPLVVNVAAGTGTLFPSPGAGQYFPLVFVNTSGQKEVMYCTSRTVDALTCTRAQEGTTARTFTSGTTGSVVGCRVTQGALTDLLNQNSSTTAAETTVVAAATTDPGASQSVAISAGTGTIDNFTVYATGTKRYVRATGAFSITSAGNIVVPGAGTLSVAIGDLFWMESIGATWVIGPYQRAANSPTATQVSSVNGGTGAVVVNPGFSNIVVLTGSGNWTVPAGITIAKVTVIGGGGAGAAGSADDYGSVSGTGGGAGAMAVKYCPGLTPAGVIAYVVGAAGVASTFAAPSGTVTANPGANSTTTTLNSSLSALLTAGGAGGVATGGDINVTGQRGNVLHGGNTMLGSGGLTSNSTSGAAGTGYGAGGGGGFGTSFAGGAGAAGTIIVEY